MSNFLRQSTASQARSVGPFVSDTDFKTVQTGLTIANTDVKLLVNGGASANKNSGGGTHRANGHYGLTFDATDTATVGEMEVSVVVAGALPTFKTFYVLEEAVYDALFVASAPGYVANAPINVAQWNGSNVATPDTAGYPKITIKSGTGTGEVALSSGTVTTGAISNDAITAASIAASAGAEIADAVWDEALSGHLGAGSAGEALDAAGTGGGGPSAADIADAVWDEDLTGHVAADSAGALLGAAGSTTDAVIADKILGRNIAGGSDGGRTVTDAFRLLRNKTSISAGTLTVTEEDDSTPAWTAAVTTAAGDPITGVDPA